MPLLSTATSLRRRAARAASRDPEIATAPTPAISATSETAMRISTRLKPGRGGRGDWLIGFRGIVLRIYNIARFGGGPNAGSRKSFLKLELVELCRGEHFIQLEEKGISARRVVKQDHRSISRGFHHLRLQRVGEAPRPLDDAA